MARCPFCGEPLLYQQDFCPACSRAVTSWSESGRANASGTGDPEPRGGEPDDVSMTSIARFRDAAEAGYFAHELRETEGIASEVVFEEDFDALRGHWSGRFVLTVPEERAEQAVEILQRMIAQTEGDEAEAEPAAGGRPAAAAESHGSAAAFQQPWNDTSTTDESGTIHWMPIVLTLAAGSAVIWGAKTFHDQPRAEFPRGPQGGEPTDLWEQVSTTSSGPWVQPMDNGRGERRLSILPDRNLVILREDADGDGRFEKEQRFRREALLPGR